MNNKYSIEQRLALVRGEFLKKGGVPTVIVGVGVDPLKDKYFREIIVIGCLPNREMIIEALEDAIKTIKGEI